MGWDGGAGDGALAVLARGMATRKRGGDSRLNGLTRFGLFSLSLLFTPNRSASFLFSASSLSRALLWTARAYKGRRHGLESV